MRTTCAILAALSLPLALSACGSSVTMQAPDDFVVLDDDYGPYDLRATSAHGVVLAAREVPNDPQGSLDFWVDAIKNRLRTMGGYALIDEADVTAGSGQPGKRLRFGRDEGGQTHQYWLAVFVTDDSIYLVEAGGRQELFEEAEERIAQAIASAQLD